jgi:fructokinase
MIHIGIDMGGTKISAIALDESGKELARERLPTPKDYESIVSTCANFVQKFQQQSGQKATVGVGSPGAIDTHEGLVRFSPNVQSMAGKFFARDLENKIQTRVRLANDAMCFALSESVDGAAAKMNRVYGIILGTGVGGALIEAGRFVPGPNTFMEWGHLPLPFADEKDIPFPRCGCGRTGCIEAYLSGPAMHTQLAEAIGREITNQELDELMAKRMPLAMEVMDTYARRLAKSFAMLITVLDPDALVLGGGVSNLTAIYEEVPKRIGNYTPVADIKTKILKAKFGDDSGLRGAAWLGAEKQ